MLVLIIYIQ